jgi:hypothetical protein
MFEVVPLPDGRFGVMGDPQFRTDDREFAGYVAAEYRRASEVRVAGKEVTPKDAQDTERLKEYWAHGEGAAKIQWGVPGDFDRCRANLGKYVPPGGTLDGLCANLHHMALGVWPGQEHGGDHKGKKT